MIAFITFDYQRHLTAYNNLRSCRQNSTACYEPPERLIKLTTILHWMQVPAIAIPGIGLLTMSAAGSGQLMIHSTRLICKYYRIHARSDQINFLLNPEEELSEISSLWRRVVARLVFEIKSAAPRYSRLQLWC